VAVWGASRTGVRIGLVELAAWSVVVFVFTIPFEEIVTIPAIGSTTRVVGLVALPLGIIALFRRGHLRFQRPMAFLVVAAAFVVWNLATYFWSMQPAVTIRQVSTYVQLLAFVWLLMEFCRDWPWRVALMQAFVLGNYVAFAITAFNVLVLSTGGFRDVGRFNANEFSILLALGIPMAALLMGERRHGLLHVLNLAYPVIATFGVVLGASRGGLIVCLVALAVVPFSVVRLSLLRRTALFVAALAALWFSFSYAPQLFPDLYRNVERLQGTGEELQTGTLTGRTTIWRETIAVFQESPLVGIGSGAARFALVDSAIGRVKAVHNAFLSVAASTGLIGLLLFVALVAMAVAAGVLAGPTHRPFLAVLAVALVVAMMPTNTEANKSTWFILGLLALQRPILLTDASDRRP
jgi:O-antigen ligase